MVSRISEPSTAGASRYVIVRQKKLSCKSGLHRSQATSHHRWVQNTHGLSVTLRFGFKKCTEINPTCGTVYIILIGIA